MVGASMLEERLSVRGIELVSPNRLRIGAFAGGNGQQDLGGLFGSLGTYRKSMVNGFWTKLAPPDSLPYTYCNSNDYAASTDNIIQLHYTSSRYPASCPNDCTHLWPLRCYLP